MEQKITTVPISDLESLVIAALMKCGVSEPDARTTCDVLVTTDTMGVFTHGVKALRGYVRRLRGGGLKAKAVPRIETEGPTWAIVDGQSGLGMVTSVFAMNTAIAKAKQSGMAYVGARNSCHFGAAGYYTLMAAKAGMIGMAMANDYPSMVVPGAKKPVLGTNPFAYAAPSGKENPVFFDIASAAVAGGKVRIYQALNKKVPDTWLVDKEGVPTTDPFMYPVDASLMPFAGHKGYGIAMMIDIFSGLLSGGASRWEIKSWIDDDPSWATHHAAAFFAIDVGQITPLDVFEKRMDETIRDIRQTPTAKGSNRVYLPGEIEWEKRRETLKDGIPFTPDVIESLQGLVKDLDMKVDWLSA
jgi:LDH2 family malate/lactate/ureidoglycolate dehydrogenase